MTPRALRVTWVILGSAMLIVFGDPAYRRAAWLTVSGLPWIAGMAILLLRGAPVASTFQTLCGDTGAIVAASTWACL